MATDPLSSQILQLGILLAGFTLMLGVLRIKAALGFIVVLVLVFLLAPSFAPSVKELPIWVLLPVLALVAIARLQGIVGLFLGRAAANEMAGSLAADLVRLAVMVLLCPLWIVRWLFRLLSPGGGLR
jgi:hypothetical protein